MLTHLRYLDYVFITDDMRKEAERKLGETVQEIDREAANEEKKGQTEREPDETLVKANIHLTEDMMKKIHAKDEVGKEFDVLKADDPWNTLE